MAKRDDSMEVTEYIRLAQHLTTVAAEYAGEEYSDREMNAMLSKVMTITASLQSALYQVRQRAAARPFPPEPEPEPEPPAKETKHGKGR